MRVIGVCGLCGWLGDWQAGQLTGCLAGRITLLVFFNLPILMAKKWAYLLSGPKDSKGTSLFCTKLLQFVRSG